MPPKYLLYIQLIVCTYGVTSCEVSTKNIRQASVRYGGYLPDYDLDVFDYFTGGDFGDCAIENGNYDFSFKSIRDKFSKILEKNKIPVVFGGDHSISYPLISEFAKKYNGKIGVIHFDAHMDNMFFLEIKSTLDVHHSIDYMKM